MTDREFAQKVLDRQEQMIGAMNAMLGMMEAMRDISLETRQTLFELVEWLQKPPSEDFGEAVEKMTAAMNTLAARVPGADK